MHVNRLAAAMQHQYCLSHSRPLPAAVRYSNVRRVRAVRVHAVFEKFSERSIKSVMFAQQEAKNLGAPEVL